jgi:hypothetical protein
MEEIPGQSVEACHSLMPSEEGTGARIPSTANESQGTPSADEGHQFFTMPNFTLTECRRRDEEDNYVDFNEDSESESDSGDDTGESEVEAQVINAIDVEVGTGGTGGRTRKRKRAKKKNKEAIGARKAARRHNEAKK